MLAAVLLLILQASTASAAPPARAAGDVDPVTVTAPGPTSMWCVRFPDSRSRRDRARMTCRTLAEWDAIRRTRYDSRGYQENLALRRFGVGLDSSLLEEASMGRVRTTLAAREARRRAEAFAEAAERDR